MSFSLFLLSKRIQRAAKSDNNNTSNNNNNTCIVNDADDGRGRICGRPAAPDRESSAPICAQHLCQHRRPNGGRCRSTPLRLAHGTIDIQRGWTPDKGESVNCSRHEKFNCVQLMNGAVRCSGSKVPGLDYCAAHAALLCRWKQAGGAWCTGIAVPGSGYCSAHCCAVESEEGHRCPERRRRAIAYCKGHQCAWKNRSRDRCGRTWHPNAHGAATCDSHMCVKEGCGKRAENDIDRCEDHVCAYSFRNDDGGGAKAEFPVCYREPVEDSTFCQLHKEFNDKWQEVVHDYQTGGRGWLPQPLPVGEEPAQQAPYLRVLPWQFPAPGNENNPAA